MHIQFKAYGVPLWAEYRAETPDDIEILSITTENDPTDLTPIISQAVYNLAYTAAEQDQIDLDTYRRDTALEMRHPDY